MKGKRRWPQVALLAMIAASCTTVPPLHQPQTDAFFERPRPSVVRMLNWNVKVNSVFAPDGVRHDSFTRIVRALDPDIICLQEILRPGSGREIADLLGRVLPGSNWSTHQVSDNVIASRFELRRVGGEEVIRHPIPGLGLPDFHYGYATALVDLPDGRGAGEIFVIAVHNKSRSGADNMNRRQRQSDAIVSKLRELRRSGLAYGTPLVILGDLNVLENPAAKDPRRHLATLLTGDIVDEASFGPDFAPDWDGTPLTDALPSLNGRGQEFYTWRVDDTPYPPGALDRILFADSVMSVDGAFVLDTTTMSTAQLARADLRADDVLLGGAAGNFDHLPMVVDFDLAPQP